MPRSLSGGPGHFVLGIAAKWTITLLIQIQVSMTFLNWESGPGEVIECLWTLELDLNPNLDLLTY